MVALAGCVQNSLLVTECIDGLGHKTFPPAMPYGLNLRLPIRTGGTGFLEQALPGRGQSFIGEQLAGPGHFIMGQIQCRRTGPLIPKQAAEFLDGFTDPRNQRHAVFSVMQCRLENLFQWQRAVIAQ